MAATVTGADCEDRAAFSALLRNAKLVAPTLAHVWLDKGYTGRAVKGAATQVGVSVKVVSGPKPASGFQIQPRRWVVERTNGWINHYRPTRPPLRKSPSKHTRGSYTSARSPYCYADSDRTQLFDTP